jgi:hypothetical protein
MLVYEDKAFDKNFPEKYPWGECDSIKLSNIGRRLAAKIEADLATDKRLYTPGLRKALLIISEYTEF